MMPNPYRKRQATLPILLSHCSCAAMLAVAIVQSGCSENATQSGASTDITALRTMVRIPDEARAARWEAFATPEYQRSVPGPTDYITLVAELDVPVPIKEPETARAGQRVFVVPEAARTWLSPQSHALLDKRKNMAFALPATDPCQPYSTIMSKSGRPVDGFLCGRSGRVLLYLTLQSMSPAPDKE